ncbi:MAG: hypothetical protein LBF95_04475 [Treponema sp.]|jgi:hypothetical protein|nr:hypothetical protein [Treponema sp.]
MKKLFLLVLVFMPVFPCLWAADDFVYDTVVTETRFTHGMGFRFGFEHHSGTIRLGRREYNPVSMSNRYVSWNESWEASFMNPGLGYQAEWKYFALDIAPGWMFWDGHRSSRNSPGLSVQPMARYPVLDNEKLRYVVLLGPNFLVDMFYASIGTYANLTQEFGVKITERFMPFLGLGIGIGISRNYMIKKVVEDSYTDWGDVRFKQPTIRFQVTLGLKTMVLEDVFYYRNKEVYRRRR